MLEIEGNQAGSFTFADADKLFDTLMKEAINRLGGIMIFDLITLSQEQLTNALDKHKKDAEIRQHLDEERKKQIELEDALKSKKGFILSSLWSDLTVSSEDNGSGDQLEGEGSLGEESQGCTPSFTNRRANFHPGEFIGSITNIIKKLPPNLQITRVGVVILIIIAFIIINYNR